MSVESLLMGMQTRVTPPADPMEGLSAEQRALVTVIAQVRKAVIEGARAVNRFRGGDGDDPGVRTAMKHIDDGLFMLSAIVRKGKR